MENYTVEDFISFVLRDNVVSIRDRVIGGEVFYIVPAVADTNEDRSELYGLYIMQEFLFEMETYDSPVSQPMYVHKGKLDFDNVYPCIVDNRFEKVDGLNKIMFTIGVLHGRDTDFANGLRLEKKLGTAFYKITYDSLYHPIEAVQGYDSGRISTYEEIYTSDGNDVGDLYRIYGNTIFDVLSRNGIAQKYVSRDHVLTSEYYKMPTVEVLDFWTDMGILDMFRKCTYYVNRSSDDIYDILDMEEGDGFCGSYCIFNYYEGDTLDDKSYLATANGCYYGRVENLLEKFRYDSGLEEALVNTVNHCNEYCENKGYDLQALFVFPVSRDVECGSYLYVDDVGKCTLSLVLPYYLE